MLKNETTLAIGGADAEENEHCKVSPLSVYGVLGRAAVPLGGLFIVLLVFWTIFGPVVTAVLFKIFWLSSSV